MADLLVVRHGESTWNAERRWQGWADAPLSDHGEEQAMEAAAHLRGMGLNAAAASDLQRARRTAEIIAASLDVGPVEVHDGLRERDVGEWTGLTVAEIEARWPGLLADWRTGALRVPPGGETMESILARVRAALVKIAATHDGRTVLVVSHGGVIRALERSVGVDPSPVPNLGGRWFSVAGDDVVAGDRLVLDPDTVTMPKSD